MSLTEFGLLVVTCGALILSIWIFAPRNKDYFRRMGEIPFQDDSPENANQGKRRV